MSRRVLGKGAEAVVTLDHGVVVKERIKKGYRHQALDHALRKNRTSVEASLLLKARRAGVHVPALIQKKEYSLVMELLKGDLLKKVLDAKEHEKNNNAFLTRIGAMIGEGLCKLHENNVVHGDLTTSNLIFDGEHVYFFDFGLGSHSRRVEDMATDLRTFKQSLESAHHKHANKIFNALLKAYTEHNSDLGKKVLTRFNKIEQRGRYK